MASITVGRRRVSILNFAAVDTLPEVLHFRGMAVGAGGLGLILRVRILFVFYVTGCASHGGVS
jgi:hypothetical protein